MKLVPLTKGAFSMVDDEDFDRVMAYGKWTLHDTNKHTSYAYNHKSGMILLHRFIMDAPREMQIDHIDCNGLNNQKSNLRICTRSENLARRKKWRGEGQYKGVSKTLSGKYSVLMNINGKRTYIGTYDTEEEAAYVYNLNARVIYKEFAFQNEIPTPSTEAA